MARRSRSTEKGPLWHGYRRPVWRDGVFWLAFGTSIVGLLVQNAFANFEATTRGWVILGLEVVITFAVVFALIGVLAGTLRGFGEGWRQAEKAAPTDERPRSPSPEPSRSGQARARPSRRGRPPPTRSSSLHPSRRRTDAEPPSSEPAAAAEAEVEPEPDRHPHPSPTPTPTSEPARRGRTGASAAADSRAVGSTEGRGRDGAPGPPPGTSHRRRASHLQEVRRGMTLTDRSPDAPDPSS